MNHNTFSGNPGENPEDQPPQPPVENIIQGEVHGTVFQVNGETFVPHVDLSNEDGPFVFQAGNIGGLNLGSVEHSDAMGTHSGESDTTEHEASDEGNHETFIQANTIGAVHTGDVFTGVPGTPQPETRQPGENPDKEYGGEPAHFELTDEERQEWEREQRAADLEKDWSADRQRAQQEADTLAESVLAQEIREELVRMGLRSASERPSSTMRPQATAPTGNRRPVAHGGLVSFHSTIGPNTRNRFRPVGDVRKNARPVEADEAPKPRRRWFRPFRKPPTHE